MLSTLHVRTWTNNCSPCWFAALGLLLISTGADVLGGARRHSLRDSCLTTCVHKLAAQFEITRVEAPHVELPCGRSPGSPPHLSHDVSPGTYMFQLVLSFASFMASLAPQAILSDACMHLTKRTALWCVLQNDTWHVHQHCGWHIQCAWVCAYMSLGVYTCACRLRQILTIHASASYAGRHICLYSSASMLLIAHSSPFSIVWTVA